MLLALTLGAAFGSPPLRPNFLVILTDDVGWGDFQCYSPQSKIVAPNVDRLAREGMRFTHAHTSSALCAPTRYSMVTGNYPWRGRDPAGTWGFNVPSQLRPGQRTAANLLRDAGYRTAMFGKAGFGGLHASKDGQPDFSRPMEDGPRQWGFDYSFIIPRGHQSPPFLFLEDERPVVGEARLVRGKRPVDYSEPDWRASEVGARMLERAARFLDSVVQQNRASGEHRPFYMHFCTDGAHSPYEPAESILGTRLRGATRMTDHTDMVLQTDILLGKLVEMLEQRGLLANTLVCFTSDNGGIPTDREFGHDAVGGLRGSKSEIWEGGHRVPLLVRWGDGTAANSRIPPGAVRHQIVGTHDLIATLLEFAGVRAAADQVLDSVSLASVLLGRRGDDFPVRRTLLVQSCPGRDAFDEGKWEPEAKWLPKILRPGNAPPRSVPASDGMAHALYEGHWKLVMNMADEPAALYDLTRHPGEISNLIGHADHVARTQAMEAAYRAIRNSARSAEVSRAAAP